jgi:hypothetical protein
MTEAPLKWWIFDGVPQPQPLVFSLERTISHQGAEGGLALWLQAGAGIAWCRFAKPTKLCTSAPMILARK